MTIFNQIIACALMASMALGAPVNTNIRLSDLTDTTTPAVKSQANSGLTFLADDPYATPDPYATADPNATADPYATTDPYATAAPTPTPEPVVAAEIVSQPSTLVFGEAPAVTSYVLNVMYASGAIETVYPSVVTADTSGTGMRNVTIEYNGFSVTGTVQVLPRQVTNIHMTAGTTSTANITWDVLPEAARYEIEVKNEATGEYSNVSSTTGNTCEFTGLTQGVIRHVRVRAVSDDPGISPTPITNIGAYSDEHAIAAKPNDMGTVTPTKALRKKITLKWESVAGATNYAVYYKKSSADDDRYELDSTIDAAVAVTSGNNASTVKYTVSNLEGGYDYTFRVIPYAVEEINSGAASPDTECGTAPTLPQLTARGGDEVIRVNWSGGRSAADYKLYISTEEDGDYTLVQTFETPVDFKVFSIHEIKTAEKAKKKSGRGKAEGNGTPIENNEYYYIKMTAERDVPGGLHTLVESDISEVITGEVNETSTEPKIYKTKKDFKKSPAYVNYKDFKKTLNKNKTFAMPGMINTNAGGFNANMMVPQDIAIAGNYMLISAYDYKKTNDSVIYVMDKKTKALKTVILLPHKGHVGGMAYDGKNIWLAYGKKLQAFSAAVIDDAVNSGEPYKELYYFTSTVETGDTISYISYYKNRLWAGAYDELNSKNVYVYQIDNKDASPTLTQTGKMMLPNRTQGIAFSGGKMIVSRSCQTNKKARGFMSQIEVYEPDIDVNSDMERGDCIKTTAMPPMNEGIAVYGKCTYVVFESVIFTSSCEAPMDRCAALKLKKLLK